MANFSYKPRIRGREKSFGGWKAYERKRRSWQEIFHEDFTTVKDGMRMWTKPPDVIEDFIAKLLKGR